MSRNRIALLSGSPIEWSPLIADYDPPILADLWPSLGVDERLSILLQQQTAEVRRLAAIAEQGNMSDHGRARLAGYANALADVMRYVVEGTPPPTLEEVG